MIYQEYGDKQASLIVFIHGGGVSGWMWDKQVAYFKEYHCVVPTLAEHGLDNHETKFSIRISARDIIDLIKDKTGDKKIIVVGFSLGAQIIVEMLAMEPDLIDFAMINSALIGPYPLMKKIINPMISLSFPLTKNRSFAKLQAKTMYLEDDYFERYYEESCQLTKESLVRVLEENMSFSLPRTFGNTKGKILVTVGEKEQGLMKKSATKIVARQPNCIGIIVPNIGHGLSLAEPDYFNQLLTKWVGNDELPEGIKKIKVSPFSN